MHLLSWNVSFKIKKLVTCILLSTYDIVLKRFAVVRDCCTLEEGQIATDTIEWRKNYQCGVSSEIQNSGSNPIRAILPLTKAAKPFRPTLTFQEFSRESFTKWRKFDLIMLSNAPGPMSFVNSSTVEIINVQSLPKEAQFRIGELGDIDICYSGWYPKKPQTLRISVDEYCKKFRCINHKLKYFLSLKM